MTIGSGLGLPDGKCRHQARRQRKGQGIHTVDVISAEHTSQTYFTPPSPPRAAIFLRITPIAAIGYPRQVTRGLGRLNERLVLPNSE